MVKRGILVIILSVIAGFVCQGEPLKDKIFSPRFKTLKTWTIGNFDSPPIIRMGTEDRVEILFDEIGEDNSWLRYRLVHCNADWEPSQLVESEYIEGINDIEIDDYAQSVATYVHYVNYRIEIPNERVNLLHSGNYLVQVYEYDNPDEILLQTRLQVSENTVPITGFYNGRTDKGFQLGYQQLGIKGIVDLSGGENPYQDFRLEIRQNIDDATRRVLPVPTRVNGNTLLYEHTPGLIYDAGNEYRRFESVSNSFPGMNVDSLHYGGSNYHVWLKADTPKDDREYSYDSTQHGRFIVREWNATDSNIGADYITVHFRLEMPPIQDGEVYVDGEMTYGEFGENNRMYYDSEARAYLLDMPLKQGAYNYRYIVKKGDGSVYNLDGDKYETSNQYVVSLWERRVRDRADRLLGVEIIEQ